SIFAQLNEAWKIRDEIHRLANSNADAFVWLPSDFAPHLWRSYNQLLVDMERRIRFGSPSVVSSVEKILQRDLQDLKTLRNSIESKDATDSRARPESALQMLLEATFDFHSQRQSSSLTVSEFNSSLQVFNQASLIASELVRWQGLRPSTEAAEVELLVAALANHNQLLNSLNHQSIDSQTQERLTQRTDQLVRALNAAMDQVHREVTDILANPREPTSRVRMESLLATWLPTAQQRFDLLNSLDRLPNPTAKPNRPTVVTNEISAAQKSQVLRQIKLEQQLVHLFSNHPSNDNSGGVANDFWKYARTESQAIRQAYESLLRPRTNESDTRFAYFLDGRDAFGTAQKLQPLSMWDIRQHLLFATMDSHEINVDVEQDRDVSIDFQLSNPENRSLNLQFEPAPSVIPQLTMQYSADTSGRFSPVPADGAVQIPMINGRGTLKLKIGASQFDESDQPEPQSIISLLAAVGSPYNRVTESLTCILPKANRIDLIVNQVGTDTPIRPRTDLSTRLRPFPNRATAFDFFLENRSGQEKTVNVQLLQVPEIPHATWPPGLLLDTAERPIRSIRNRLFFEDSFLTRPDIRVIAKAESLVLPANGERKKIVFANASAAPDKTEASAAPSDGANGPNQTVVVDHDISYGLVCLVSNASDVSEFWPKWIELSVLHPSSYVDAAAVFNPANRQLNVTVRATKDAPLPINVVWHTSDLANSVQQDQRNVIESAAAPVRFSQTITNESSASADISLDIDEYPRAIIQQIELVSGAESQPIRNRHEIRIKSVEVTDSSTQSQPQQIQTQQRPSLFRLDQLPATMRVELEIDSPADAFATSAGRDKIDITLSPTAFDSQRVSYYSDRTVTTYLKAPAATGSLVMETVVTDVIAELNPSSTNVQAQLEASLIVSGRSEDTFVHTVILDGDNPIGEVSPARKIFDVGKPLDFAWTASDRSGISKAEFLLATSKSKAFPDEVEATVEVDDSAHRIRQKFQLATGELNVPEGAQREFWLRARFSDGVGHQFESQESVTIRSPRGKSTNGDGQAESEQEVKGTLTVIVQMASGTAPVRPQAIIKDRDDLIPVPMGDGVFAFQDLPAGEYEIEASGIAGGQQKTGSKKVVLKTLSDYGKKVIVNIK
ncbi:MAG: hypothetical protein KDA87_21655, partial [Planctomycetales bacterium]|nr:hypothetical protein [Planctomycetales bacterium]